MSVHQRGLAEPRYHEQPAVSCAVWYSLSQGNVTDVRPTQMNTHSTLLAIPLLLLNTSKEEVCLSYQGGPNLNSYRYKIKAPGTLYHYDQEVVQFTGWLQVTPRSYGAPSYHYCMEGVKWKPSAQRPGRSKYYHIYHRFFAASVSQYFHRFLSHVKVSHSP